MPIVSSYAASTTRIRPFIATVRAPDQAQLRQRLLVALGVALLVAPLLRLPTGGPGWAAAISGDLRTVLSMDIAFLVGGAFCIPHRFARSAGC